MIVQAAGPRTASVAMAALPGGVRHGEDGVPSCHGFGLECRMPSSVISGQRLDVMA